LLFYAALLAAQVFFWFSIFLSIFLHKNSQTSLVCISQFHFIECKGVERDLGPKSLGVCGLKPLHILKTAEGLCPKFVGKRSHNSVGSILTEQERSKNTTCTQMERMFEQAAHALEDPLSHAAAARYLEDLRVGSPTQSVQLARSVLSTTASPLAQFQAIVLLRVCLLSAWSHYGPTGEGAQIRDWLLTLAMQRCSAGSEGGVASFSPQVLSQVLVTVAVLYKRGWLEDSPASRAAFRCRRTTG
jgi:hypothetical protein